MKSALALLPFGIGGAALAQVALPAPNPQAVIAPIDSRTVRPLVLKAAPPACALVPGGTAGIIGEDGSEEVIGEKIIGEKIIGEKVIGEKGSEEVIGEKGSEEVIGEKVIGEYGSQASLSFGHRWRSNGPRVYNHVIAGPPGTLKVTVYACSTMPSGQSIRLSAPSGGLQHSLVASASGATRSALLTLPKGAGAIAKVPLTISIDNPAGAPVTGVYKVTITR